jgi:hemerythrin
MRDIMADNQKFDKILDNLFSHSVFIAWKSEYDLGISIIDEQHRGIVTIINSLFYSMQNKHEVDILTPVYGMINEYTLIHFKIEENFMKKYAYPEFIKHNEFHNELIDKLNKVGKKSLHQHDPKEFFDFLKGWWINHICNEDRAFLEYLLKTWKK